MQITGMLHGAKLLQFAGFATAEVLGADASEEEIREGLEGNLCRCTGYENIIKAVQMAQSHMNRQPA